MAQKFTVASDAIFSEAAASIARRDLARSASLEMTYAAPRKLVLLRIFKTTQFYVREQGRARRRFTLSNKAIGRCDAQSFSTFHLLCEKCWSLELKHSVACRANQYSFPSRNFVRRQVPGLR